MNKYGYSVFAYYLCKQKRNDVPSPWQLNTKSVAVP